MNWSLKTLTSKKNNVKKVFIFQLLLTEARKSYK
jgi:hypothetical protein